MVSTTFIVACIASLAAAPQTYGSFGQAPASSSYTPITAPKGAAQWGSTSQSQSSSGSTQTYDNEVHSGTASNFGNEITHYGSQGTNYANQASSSNTVGGSQTQYSSATNTPSYGSYSGAPSTSGQSTTVGGQINNFSNSQNSGSSVVGGFVTQGVTGSSYTNNQASSGGSSTQTQSSFSNAANAGSSWYIPAKTGYGY
ncbi:hypothetical protein CONCODRAFT_10362 [Conidiobolus coronatus NRRL 28638]|uniref:Uncharacterized protein n=1 Tax=Conidiobolus coronatus (strain ATCC 28846 / CBS 209.66 / NRRL 28638) TaxID=796925 RepID=A0A137NXH4_CONC2|nr:hypothetical protein CONCODRAFT_10362 [Conidiobolus coronatus NRRL 28638]|eukprot:KXN67560.1 hypothetical protein CONCODRAFT_10362 [Conidiobolus coronatus NRRL 28638]